MSDADHDLQDTQRAALEAAAQAFAAARSARRFLDGAGRRGAAAVKRSRAIPGARRASNKAQTNLEDSARKLEAARDRWAALMRGLAADLNIEPSLLVAAVERYALDIALEELEAALLGARDAAALLGGAPPEALAASQRALLLLGGGSPDTS